MGAEVTRRRLLVGAAFLPLAIYSGLVLSLLCFFQGDRAAAALLSHRVQYSAGLSLVCATIATALSCCVALPAAYALSRMRFRGRWLADTVLELPILVSPAALGALILIFFTNPFGAWFQRHVPLIFAVPGVMAAQFVSVVGLTTRYLRSTFDEVPARYEGVARSLGASPLIAFSTVTLPLARRGILSALVLTWAKAIGEFGATITVAGTMAMKTETLPTAIFMSLASADIEGAVVLILLLILIGFGSLLLARSLGKGPHAHD